MKEKIVMCLSFFSIVIAILNMSFNISFGSLFIKCEEAITNSTPCYMIYDIYFSSFLLLFGILFLGISTGNYIYKKFN